MGSGTLPFKVKAIYEYKSEYEDDLCFSPGQIITVTEVEDEEWYSGRLDGKSGMFPKNFVEVVKEEPEIGKGGGQEAPESEKEEQSKDTEVRQAHKTTASVAQQVDVANYVKNEADTKGEGIETGTKEQQDKKESKASVPSIPKVPTGVSQAEPESGDGRLAEEAGKAKSEKVTAKPPMPYLSQKKTEDPYAIKRQFLAAGKSSYVPPIKPRDTSNVIHHVNEPKSETEVVRESSQRSEIDEEGPKISLQERIAILQKKQQEEAEREAAALKKREERKKAALEREKQKKTRELESQKSGESNFSRQSTGELGAISSPTSHGFSDTNEDALDNNQDDPSRTSGEMNRIQEQEETEPAEENEEDELDEELKRKKLVERMAKISGGRNMFGMLGIPTPFASEAAKAAESPKTETSQKEEQAPEEKSRPIPVMPFADASKLPHALSKTDEQGSTGDDEETNPQAGRAGNAMFSESSSMVEDDDPSESDSKVIHDDRRVHNTSVPSSPNDGGLYQVQSDSTVERSEDEQKSITLGRQALDNEATGYDADEDLSDIAKTGARRGSTDNKAAVPNVEKDGKESRGSFDIARETRRTPSELPPVPPAVPSRAVPPIPEAVTRDEDKTFVVDDDAQNSPIVAPEISKSPLSVNTESRAKDAISRAPPPIPESPVPISDDISEKPDLNEHDEDFEFDNNLASEGGHPVSQFSPSDVSSLPPPPPPPSSSIPKGTHRRTSTELSFKQGYLPRSSTEKSLDTRRQSTDSSLDGGKGQRNKHSSDKTQAEQLLDTVLYELANISGSSNWWLKGELPDSLIDKVGSDLIFEVDANSITKRSNRTINYRDYYILFYDLSQLVFELEYESEDPRSTIKLINNFSKPMPVIRKDLLDKYHIEFSSQIVDSAAKLLNSKVASNIATLVLGKMKNIVPPIGTKSFGVTIYKNINNSSIAKIDEVRSGDILWIKQAKYVNHKGLMGTSKTLSIGDSTPYASIIYDYDPKKERFKVLETDPSGLVKKESYKLSDFKSGRLRVFRVVSRDYIEW